MHVCLGSGGVIVSGRQGLASIVLAVASVNIWRQILTTSAKMAGTCTYYVGSMIPSNSAHVDHHVLSMAMRNSKDES